MALVNVDLRCVRAAGHSGEQQRIIDRARPPRPGATTQDLEDEMLRLWSWAPDMVSAAEALAAELAAAGDKPRADVAIKIAERNRGVWRAVDLLERRSTGERAAVPVRPHAGDRSCPQYLRGCAFTRAARMTSYVAAARLMNWQVFTACTAPMSRDDSRVLGARLKGKKEIRAGDTWLEPTPDGRVRMRVLLALSGPEEVAAWLTCELGVALEPAPDDLRSIYDGVRLAAVGMGPRLWLRACMATVGPDGKRTQDGRSWGAWYGAAAKDLLAAAASIPAHASQLAAAQADDRAAVEGQLEIARAAAEFVKEAVASGDLSAGAEGLLRARAAAADARTVLADRACGSLAIAQIEVVVGRCARSLADERRRQRDEGPPPVTFVSKMANRDLLSRLRALPGPAPRPAADWRVVERVDLRTPADVRRVAQWLRPPRCQAAACPQTLTSEAELACGRCADCTEGAL